jgi:hypothetical protein
MRNVPPEDGILVNGRLHRKRCCCENCLATYGPEDIARLLKKTTKLERALKQVADVCVSEEYDANTGWAELCEILFERRGAVLSGYTRGAK